MRTRATEINPAAKPRQFATASSASKLGHHPLRESGAPHVRDRHRLPRPCVDHRQDRAALRDDLALDKQLLAQVDRLVAYTVDGSFDPYLSGPVHLTQEIQFEAGNDDAKPRIGRE